MADSSILSDFGINILEQEIDDVIFQTNEFLCDATFTGSQGPFWWLLVVVEIQSRNFYFIHCKSVTCISLYRDTKSARDKNGTKPRKNKGKNTLLEISLAEHLCFSCKGTYLSLDKRRNFPISLIINIHFDLCTLIVVIASGFALKLHNLLKLGVKYCFAFCWAFSETGIGNRTNDVPDDLPIAAFLNV